MTWVAWRQQRLQMLIIVGVVVVAAAALVGIGFDAASLHGHGGEQAVGDRYGTFLSLLPWRFSRYLSSSACSPGRRCSHGRSSTEPTCSD
jgi:hypothetical protein